MDQGTLSNTNTNTSTKKNSAAPCPNSAKSAHKKTSASRSVLSQEQVWTELADIQLQKHGRLMREARIYGERVKEDPDDLLQEAILRAMTTRSWPVNVKAELFLKGIMRSIASTISRSRERNISLGCLGDDFVFDARDVPVASHEDGLLPHESEEAFEVWLAMVAKEDPEIEAVLKGRNAGLRGKDLADHAGISQAELATIQRRIKRKGTSIAHTLGPLAQAA